MTREIINPDSMYDSLQFGFSHAATTTAQKTIYCAGQVAWDNQCNLIGGDDIAAQAQQALQNLKTVLATAGATPADVVRMRTFVVDHKPEYLAATAPAIAEFYGDATPAPNTWLGVQSLALPGLLIEFDVTAVVDV